MKRLFIFLLLVCAGNVFGAAAEPDKDLKLYEACTHSGSFGLYDSHVEEIRQLLAEGADPNALNTVGAPRLATAISFALTSNPEARKRYHNVARMLLEHNANPNWIDTHPKTSPRNQSMLMRAIGHSKGWRDDMFVQLLLTFGADPNHQDGCGQTALHQAIESRPYLGPNILALLLDNRANPNIQDGKGRTALHKAIECFALDGGFVVQQLLNRGARVDIRDNDGKTPLDLALERSPLNEDEKAQLDDVIARLRAVYPSACSIL